MLKEVKFSGKEDCMLKEVKFSGKEGIRPYMLKEVKF